MITTARMVHWKRIAVGACVGSVSMLLFVGSSQAQTGKIAGRVVDASGESVPGVNIAVVGTTQGAVADEDGYYVILNVSPGSHALRASFVGYAPHLVDGVRVNIDQTTTIDFVLVEETVDLGEVVVTAEVPVVRTDVSNSQVNLSAERIEVLPLSSVSNNSSISSL